MKDIDVVALAENLGITSTEALALARRVHVTQICPNDWHASADIRRFERCPECPILTASYDDSHIEPEQPEVQDTADEHDYDHEFIPTGGWF